MRKSVARAQNTEEEMLAIYNSLPVEEQREIFRDLKARKREHHNLVELDDLLAFPEIREEAGRLARAADIPIEDFMLAVNPFRYTNYATRSRSGRCTMHKISNVDYGRFAEVAEVSVRIKANGSVRFEHRQVREELSLHVMRGAVQVQHAGIVKALAAPRVMILPAGEPFILTAGRRSEFEYVGHPLTALILQHVKPEAALFGGAG